MNGWAVIGFFAVVAVTLLPLFIRDLHRQGYLDRIKER